MKIGIESAPRGEIGSMHFRAREEDVELDVRNAEARLDRLYGEKARAESGAREAGWVIALTAMVNPDAARQADDEMKKAQQQTEGKIRAARKEVELAASGATAERRMKGMIQGFPSRADRGNK